MINKFKQTELGNSDQVQTPIIATLHSREGVLKIINILGVEANPLSQIYDIPFRDEILQYIINHKAIIACNALDKAGKLGGYQIISNETRENKISYAIYNK